MSKRKMPSRRQITAHWVGRHSKVQDESDADYCFACGDHYRLERAHILPRIDGGDDSVENLHVLCASCHIESEFLSGAVYWSWFDQKPYRSHLWHVAERMARLPDRDVWESYRSGCAVLGVAPIPRSKFRANMQKIRVHIEGNSDAKRRAVAMI